MNILFFLLYLLSVLLSVVPITTWPGTRFTRYSTCTGQVRSGTIPVQ